jgi:hypothetical protein
MLGRTHTESSKQKIAASHIGKHHSEEAISLNRIAHKDKPLSDDQKENI